MRIWKAYRRILHKLEKLSVIAEYHTLFHKFVCPYLEGSVYKSTSNWRHE
jgi:hypothetical protein